MHKNNSNKQEKYQFQSDSVAKDEIKSSRKNSQSLVTKNTQDQTDIEEIELIAILSSN